MQQVQPSSDHFTGRNSDNPMVFAYFRNRKNNRAIFERQYGSLTQVVRDPVFYTDFAVPDTVMGRFELLSIVMILYFRRTRHSQKGGQQIAQTIVDAFFQDIDHSMRELGVGDHGVPKRMKKFASMFYGRLKSYAEAMDAKDSSALAQALSRNIFAAQDSAGADLQSLADWMMMAEQNLLTQSEEHLLAGNLIVARP